MKSYFKRFMSVLLAFVICLPFGIPAFAATPSSQSDSNLQTVIAQIQSDMPGAEIRVVDDVIHIVVNDLSDVPGFEHFRTQGTRTTSVTSSIGGTYRNFDIPWHGYLSYVPYSQVYMSKDIVDGLKLQMTEPTIAKWIVDQLGQGLTTIAVASLAYSVWGISITAGVVSAIGSFLYWTVSNLEYWSLNSAQSNSTTGKVSVVRGTTYDGYYSNIYSPWNNNTCTTYASYEATWYEGEYDV